MSTGFDSSMNFLAMFSVCPLPESSSTTRTLLPSKFFLVYPLIVGFSACSGLVRNDSPTISLTSMFPM